MNDSLLKKFAVSKSVGVDETDVNYYNSHNVNYHDGHFHTQNTNILEDEQTRRRNGK